MKEINYFIARSEPNPSTGCWIWQKAKNNKGYGVCRVDGETWLAHRASMSAFIGKPVEPGLMVCHRCDTPSCVNPNHLFTGLAADNSLDMKSKGRQQQLGGHWNASLCASDVKEIRLRAGIGEDQSSIANLFGVSQSTVSEIHTTKGWSGHASNKNRQPH